MLLVQRSAGAAPSVKSKASKAHAGGAQELDRLLSIEPGAQGEVAEAGHRYIGLINQYVFKIH